MGTLTPTPIAKANTVVIALAQSPVSLDPADHRDRASETVLGNIFDGLVRRNAKNTIELNLAEKLVWLDEKTLVIYLKRGILFHDGVQMTAEDVVFTFSRIIQEEGITYPAPHNSPRQSLLAPLERVEYIDTYTVKMYFSDPWPAAQQMLAHQQIVPKHYIMAAGAETFNARPIGTGAFRFINATSDLSKITLERFEGYYKRPGDSPSAEAQLVQQVIFLTIPDGETRAAALNIGAVDIIQNVPVFLLQDLEKRPHIHIKAVPGTQPQWLELNVNQPPFNDVRVRRALNYAIDKPRLIEDVYHGHAAALPGPLSPFNTFVNPDLAPYRYDIVMAGQYLDDAGWQDRDGDGLRDRGGIPFTLVIDTLQVWSPLAQAIAQQLREIGVEAKIRIWEREAIQPLLRAGERMAYLDDWGDSAFDPAGHFEAKWHSPTAHQPYGYGNYSGYHNARVDALIEEGETTIDLEARQRLYYEAQEIIYTDAPAVFLMLPEQIEAASTHLYNWQPASDSQIQLHDIYVKNRE